MNRVPLALATLAMCLGCAKEASAGFFVTLDPPWGSNTVVTGVSGNDVVGYYSGGGSGASSFLFNGSSYVQLVPPGATETLAYGVSGNNFVGTYRDSSGFLHGFLYNGSYTTLNPPGATNTEALAVSGNNVVGIFRSGGIWNGFLYNGSSYTTLAVPGANNAGPLGVSGNITSAWMLLAKSMMTHSFRPLEAVIMALTLPDARELSDEVLE